MGRERQRRQRVVVAAVAAAAVAMPRDPLQQQQGHPRVLLQRPLGVAAAEEPRPSPQPRV